MAFISKIKEFKKKKTERPLREKKIYYFPTGSIIPNPNQTRKNMGNISLSKLSDSIQKYGIIEPIIIRKRDNVPYIEMDGERIYAEKYEIVAGERRWRAAMSLNMNEIPCILTDSDEKTSLEMSLAENIQRENLHFLEETEGASRLIRGFGVQVNDAAETISLSKAALAKRFKILNTSEEEKKAIIKSGLSERHIIAISKIEDEEKRFSIMEQAVSTSMSAPEAERVVDEILNPIYRTKGDEKRKVTVISDIGFFLNSLNRAIGILENSGTKIYKSELDSDGFLEINLKIRKKPKVK